MNNLVRLPDWDRRLAGCLNARAGEPYRYGISDCACLARAAVEAVTGVDIMPGVEMPRGWIAAAKFMIARGWESVEDAATLLLGQPVDAADSRPGDLVSFESGDELHLAVRVGETALTPTPAGTQPIARAAWRQCWKVG